jgi:malate dehydrogenase
MNKKITVVGAGNVGATTAQLIAEKNLGDVVLIDIVEGIPQGKALDIQEACPLWNSSVRVTGTNRYDDTSGSDIVVITAGLARKPGMRRGDLIKANADIVREVTKNIKRTSPNAIIIVVTNPMDVMTYLAWKASNFPHERVIGMGGVLDSSRMRTFIALEPGVSMEDVRAIVLGGHGDLMVPLSRLTTIRGKPVREVLPESKVEDIIERTKNGGAEIVGLLKSGSAYFAPAASIVEMIEAILGVQQEPLPCSAYLDGKYGVRGVYLGAPVRLSARGVEEIVELDITDDEKQEFMASAERVRELIQEMGID